MGVDTVGASGPLQRVAFLSSLFVELMESLRQAEQKNWSLDQHHIANLCDSLNHFLTQTGHVPPQGGSHRPPASARIADSCALTSGKQEPAMNQGSEPSKLPRRLEALMKRGGGGQKTIEKNHLMSSDPD